MKTKAKRRLRAAAVALSAIALLCAAGGCEYQLYVSNGISAVENGAIDTGSGGQDTEDPRGGKILDEGLGIYNMPTLFDTFTEEELYSQSTFGRSVAAVDTGYIEAGYTVDPNEETRGKYILPRINEVSTSKLDSGGFDTVQFVLYQIPQEGEFTMRARILITGKAGDSTSKGYFFGAMTGTQVTKPGSTEFDHVEIAKTSHGAGLLYRTRDTADTDIYANGAGIRPYYVEEPSGWKTGSTHSSDNFKNGKEELWLNYRPSGWKQECIVEVVRANRETKTFAAAGTDTEVEYSLRVYNSKTGSFITEGWIESDEVAADLRCGQPVYLGAALLGCSLEFSEFTIWDTAYDNETPVTERAAPIFATPATKPAYVAVETLKLNTSKGWSSKTDGDLISTSTVSPAWQVALNTPITIIPEFEPSYADNKYCDWEIVTALTTLPLETITLQETDIPATDENGAYPNGGNQATVTLTQRSGTVVIMATSRDPGKADWSLKIVVN
jgi:hypothetical protein